MNGVFLDSAIKSLARYLVKLEDLVTNKYNGSINVKDEIESLNQQYGFVPKDQVAAFTNDIYGMYQFERNRKLQSIDGKAYAKFKWDQASGANEIQRLKNELHIELTGIS